MTSVADRIKETTTTTGTGAITLSGAQTGFNSFSSAFAVGSSVTFYYTISSNGGAEWETGFGYLSGSTTLVRQTVTGSSNAGALVSFSAGNKDVYCSATAAMLENAAINQSKSGTVVASFVYDTTKDSDGGAWRDRCSHLSWYNETLNTATRGATRKFPAIAGIVATATTVTIYDLTDVTSPMWMVFNLGSFVWTTNILQPGSSSIYMINGILYIGNSSSFYGVNKVSFITDSAYIYAASSYGGDSGVNIAGRNGTVYYAQGTASGLPALANQTVNCITATVLPTAPIDNATGLPVPTVWVGTLGGVSRIADDGTVSNWTDTSGNSAHQVYNITIDGDYVYFTTSTSSLQPYGERFLAANTLSGSSYGGASFCLVSYHTSVWNSNYPAIHYGGQYSAIADWTKGAVATSRSLTLLKPNTTAFGSSLYATITKDFNSGYQFGDIRGAWLCQGTAETLTATDLVTGDSSTFTSTIGGWLSNGSGDITFSASAGVMQIVRGSGGTAGNPYLSISTVVGKCYVLTFTVSGTSAAYRVGTSLSLGNVVPPTTAAVGTISVSFIATALTTYIELWCAAVSTTSNVDNVTVKLAEPDVSYNNRALTVVGSIVKSAVNTGCDLMAYSGWSASNYMQMAYNSAYDFGTGDFHISCWNYRPSAPVTTECILDRAIVGVTDNKNRILFYTNAIGNIVLSTYDSTPTNTIQTSLGVAPYGVWVKLDVIRLSTGSTSFYINGVLDSTIAGTVRSVSSTVNAIFVGVTALPNAPNSGKIDLLHISAGAPTVAQIKTTYDREKLMFVANTKCLLPGTSNDVKAVAYDDSTDTHHYVTVDYYGAHNGLVRVDSAAGVYTSISASNGAIIKGA